jgi:hypothetical protein
VTLEDQKGAMIELDLSSCRKLGGKGDRSRCKSDDGTDTAFFFAQPSKKVVRFKIFGSGKADNAALEGRLVVTITTHDSTRAGTSPICDDPGGTLSCRKGQTVPN